MQSLDIAGRYVGRSKVRPGMEHTLVPMDKKRLSKEEGILLEIRENGTFLHKKTTFGKFEVDGSSIRFKPTEFNGCSLQSMKQAAAEAGRAFGLSWLFDPFELVIVGESLETADRESVIYIEYVRKGS